MLAIQRADQAAEHLDGVARSEIRKAVAAARFRRNPVPRGTDGTGADMCRLIIQRKKRLDARRKIAHNGFASRQIAQTFFATVANKQHAACRPGIQSVKNIHQRQHARHVCRVIANARTIQSSSLLAHRHGLKIGKYRIDVRHDDDDILILR